MPEQTNEKKAPNRIRAYISEISFNDGSKLNIKKNGLLKHS